MLHHASLCSVHPIEAAQGLARLLAADVIRAPTPPFPEGSWFVVLRDLSGTMIEVLPADIVYRSGAAGGMARQEGALAGPKTHMLLSTPLTQAWINAIAGELGWHTSRANAGLFAYTEVWVQNNFLIELMTPSQAALYRKRFGLIERSLLEQRLRKLERTLSKPAKQAGQALTDEP